MSLAKFSWQLRILLVAASFLCFVFPALAKPRTPQPPWPQATIKIFGFDSPYQKVPWREVAFNEEEATLVESWSGYALERSGVFLSPVVIPVCVSEQEVNLDPARGSIRFWLAPNWSTANVKSGGAGPGHLAHLLELVQLDGKAADVRWALFLNEAGDTVHLVGQTKLGLTEILQAPVAFAAGDWRMITLGYSETNTVLLLDNEVIAKGEGVRAPTAGDEPSLGLVIGSDVLASPDSLAEAQFEELTTMRQWPRQSDWQALYFQATKRRSLLGAQGTKAEEQAKVEVLKGARLLPEEYGLAKSSGEGDGPIMAYSYAEGTLWLEITGVSNNLAYLIVHGTVADTAYEILSKASLTNAEWAGEQPIVLGTTGQDWTPTTVTMGTRTNELFFWARTLVDTDGDGLPDWWELNHGLDPNNPDTSNTGVSDGYKDGDNDGWNNLQEYQNGTNPNSFNTPAAPSGLQITLSSGGSVATIRWHPSSGPVTGYTLERSFTNQTLQVSAGATQVTDTSVVFPTWLYYEFQAPQFRLRANYAGGSSPWTPWQIPSECRAPAAQIVSSSGGTLLAVPDLGDAAGLRVGAYDYDINYYPVSVTNVAMAPSSFVNGLAAAPEPFASGAFNRQGFAQAISSNGIPSATAYLGWPGLTPFWDGRAQLKDNLRFLLRAATPDSSFGFIKYGGSHDPTTVSSPGNYAYSGFYVVGEYLADDDPYWYPNADTDPLLPFKDNYRYRNFVFSSTNLDASGSIKTGIYWDSALKLLTPEQTIFQPPATVSPIPSVLTSGESQWTVWREDTPFPSDLLDWDSGVTLQSEQYQMTGGARNLFGLPYLSFHFAWGSNATEMAILNPSAPVDDPTYGYFYPETAQPAFQTVDYYFARQYGDWYEHTNEARLPGHTAFSPTNTSPLLITSVDDPSFRLAGYAKLAVTNGYAGVYGYLGQYFDKAYKTTNGVVTTNETGILSPYGEFFPTEPGRVALVTMPDLDTGARGTATVYCVKMELDVNHDGTIDRTFAGSDNTSLNSPFRFWVNNDYDGSGFDDGADAPANGVTDARDGEMKSKRDLEDFARLWISGIPPLPAGQGYSVTISSTGPGIQLFPAFESAEGGIGYLTNTTVAANQITSSSRLALGVIAPGTNYIFPDGYFASYGRKHFLFEGVTTSAGAIMLTISKGTDVLLQHSVFMDLRDVKEMYERADAENVTAGLPPSSLVSQFKISHSPDASADSSKQIIVFVHGINNTEFAYQNTTETFFKRLYWAGYQGRVAGFRWPCAYLPNEGSVNPGEYLKAFNYNKGEFYAWKSANAFKLYLQDLTNRLAGYQINILAHSQGNVVASEALKQGAPFDNFILSQGAISAHCYDTSTNVPLLQKFLDKEATSPTPLYATNGGYHGYFENLPGNMVNFYNPDDYALATGKKTILGIEIDTNWEANHLGYKPESFNFGGLKYSYNPATQQNLRSLIGGNATNIYVVTDFQEAKSMVARTRSAALGAQAGVGGVINTTTSVNLNVAPLLFGLSRDEHSAQFTRTIQNANGYYDEVLQTINLPIP